MKEEFFKHIELDLPFLKESRLLIATSGGMDSMVLTHLLMEAGYSLGLAHVNFGLRGAESDEDEAFIEDFARKHNIPLYIHHPETEVFAKVHRSSIQMAARELRYAWFRQLLNTEPYDYLLTAHHADDNVETFLINIQRRTGLAGLTGIPMINGKIIRPMLPFSRSEIISYANINEISWREDSSNAKHDYLRNKFRHNLIPALQNTFPDYPQAFYKVMQHLQYSRRLIADYIQNIKPEIWKEVSPLEIHIDIPALLTFPHPGDILFELLKDYGFASRKDLQTLINTQSGKTIISASHRIIKDREKLILVVHNQTPAIELIIDENQKTFQLPMRDKTLFFRIDSYPKPQDFSAVTRSGEVFFDRDKLHFPLKVRRWKPGDYFYPLGMKGKKKISDYLTDRKVSLYEKENIYLLCDSRGEILWIIGMRTDNRYRIKQNTSNILEIKNIN